MILFAFLGCDPYYTENCTKIASFIIALHVVHLFPRWRRRCCRTLSELCTNYLLYLLSNFKFSAKLLNRNCYRLSRILCALAQISCFISVNVDDCE